MPAAKDEKKKKQKRAWHVDLGDSSKGPVGMCAVVKASSKAEVIQKLTRSLPEEVELKRYIVIGPDGGDGGADNDIEYVNIYLSPKNIKLSDIRREPL